MDETQTDQGTTLKTLILEYRLNLSDPVRSIFQSIRGQLTDSHKEQPQTVSVVL